MFLDYILDELEELKATSPQIAKDVTKVVTEEINRIFQVQKEILFNGKSMWDPGLVPSCIPIKSLEHQKSGSTQVKWVPEEFNKIKTIPQEGESGEAFLTRFWTDKFVALGYYLRVKGD